MILFATRNNNSQSAFQVIHPDPLCLSTPRSHLTIITITTNREGDPQTQKAIFRILDIWDERKVYPTPFLDEIRKTLRGEINQVHEQVCFYININTVC